MAAACLLAGCGGQGAADRTSPAASTATVDPRVGTLPRTDDAASLSGQLDRAAATVRDRHASPTDVRRAAELQQLAVGALATASGPFRRQVLARLDPATASVVGPDVTAAQALSAMTGPQRSLPHWRILAPRPAAELLGYYREAQRRTGVPWTYLAAINLVESRMGRINGASPVGAQGPMQFMPSTWKIYGAGGDINDPRDAILAAARLLKDTGAPGDMAGAVRHYNASDRYVRAVTAYASTMQRSPSAFLGYWHWRVLYRQSSGTYLLLAGYPRVAAVPLPAY